MSFSEARCASLPARPVARSIRLEVLDGIATWRGGRFCAQRRQGSSSARQRQARWPTAQGCSQIGHSRRSRMKHHRAARFPGFAIARRKTRVNALMAQRRATRDHHVLLLVSPRCWPQSMRMHSPVMVVAPSTRNSAATATSRGQMPRVQRIFGLRRVQTLLILLLGEDLARPGAEHAARAERIDPHLRRERARHRQRQIVDRGLRGRVGHRRAARAHRADRRDVDDRGVARSPSDAARRPASSDSCR